MATFSATCWWSRWEAIELIAVMLCLSLFDQATKSCSLGYAKTG